MSNILCKDLILPKGLQADEKTVSDTYAKFVAEPYESGYGHTVGNSLRRILLSSLEGAAVTAVRVDGARHEYSTVSGVREDVVNILLNLKKLRVRMYSEGPETLFLSAKGAGPVTAAKITENERVEVVNKNLVIANLEAGARFEAEIEIAKGRGYVPAEELRKKMHWPAGFIPVDALFSPIHKVHYEVENARIGQRTDYDRLVLEIWTDGTITPMDAVNQTAVLLRRSLIPFLPEEELARETGEGVGEASAEQGGADSGKNTDILSQTVDVIELSSRASNCLKVAGIRTVGELVRKNDEELLAVKNFGKKSLDEIKEKLKDMGFDLGIKAG
ncbi:MAG: DNA-directed RNA polymerase subunit alpha [bacterium]